MRINYIYPMILYFGIIQFRWMKDDIIVSAWYSTFMRKHNAKPIFYEIFNLLVLIGRKDLPILQNDQHLKNIFTDYSHGNSFYMYFVLYYILYHTIFSGHQTIKR